MPTSVFDVAHLLRRAGFGGTTAEIVSLTGLDRAALVNHVLDFSSMPSDAAQSWLFDNKLEQYEKTHRLMLDWIWRMVTSPCPLVEKMTLFWHNHFVSGADKVFIARHFYDQIHLYRSNALGNFRDLAQAAAQQPALLTYLDNDPNDKGNPNENFARELMELFLLGVDQYSQSDVAEGARAWTGHGVSDSDTYPVSEFHPELHDNDNKTIFGITRNWDGPEIIDHICIGPKQPIMAKFIARKVWSFFAYPNPSDAIVQSLADTFVAKGLSMKELVRAVFLHDEFWGATARNGLVRNPIEYVVAAMKGTGFTNDVAHPEWWLEDMGMEPFYPPNVAGWKQNGYWLSSTAFWRKADFAQYLGWKISEGKHWQAIEGLPIDQAVQWAFDRFGLTEVSTATRTKIQNWLSTTRSADSWYQQPGLVTAVLLTAEFQLA